MHKPLFTWKGMEPSSSEHGPVKKYPLVAGNWTVTLKGSRKVTALAGSRQSASLTTMASGGASGQGK